MPGRFHGLIEIAPSASRRFQQLPNGMGSPYSGFDLKQADRTQPIKTASFLQYFRQFIWETFPRASTREIAISLKADLASPTTSMVRLRVNGCLAQRIIAWEESC